MSDVKMSKWFKLPVSCMLQLNGDSPHASQDSISFDGVNVMTGHHVEKVVVAINSYDSNQELIAKQAAQIEQLRENVNQKLFHSKVSASSDIRQICGKLGIDEDLILDCMAKYFNDESPSATKE